MRTRPLLAVALALALSSAGLALPARAAPADPGEATGATAPRTTVSKRVSRRVGSRWLGADVARGVVARIEPDESEVEVSTEARLRLLTATVPVFRVRERTLGADLQTARRRAWRGTEVDLLGTARLSITQDLFKRNFKVRSVKLPVFTVGPFPVTLEPEVGAYLRIRLKGELAWKDGPSTAGGVEGMARIGGTARLGPGAPLAKVGIKGELDLIKARMPAMVTLYRDAVVLDLKLIVESRAAIRLFARFGIGPFTKEVVVGVPFLSWRLFRLEATIARLELRAARRGP